MLRKCNKKQYFNKSVCLYKQVRLLGSGESFGDIAIRTKRNRTASIYVESEKCILVTMNIKIYKELYKQMTERIKEKEDSFLMAFPKFSRICLNKFILHFKERVYKSPQYVFRKGDKTENIYFIKQGEIELQNVRSEDTYKSRLIEANLVDTVKGYYSKRKTKVIEKVSLLINSSLFKHRY